MTSLIQCPGCGQRYQAGPNMVGKQLKCNKCGKVFATPAGTQVIEPDNAELRVADLLDEVKPPAPSLQQAATALSSQSGASDNPYRSPTSTSPAADRKYRRYEDVPWYRTSSTNTVFALVGWLLFPPLLWWCCINLVTGDVYYNEMQNGELKKWSTANKVVAAVFLLINTAVLIRVISNGGKL